MGAAKLCDCTTHWRTTPKRFEIELQFFTVGKTFGQCVIGYVIPHYLELLFKVKC